MAKDKPAPAGKDLTERELPELLLWLFNTTGHRQHVEAWRASKAKPKSDDAGGAGAGDDE